MNLKGKKGLIFGVANKRSIAWAIAKAAVENGSEIALAYQNDRLKSKVEALAPEVGCDTLLECDATQEDQVKSVMSSLDSKWGSLDYVVHAIAFAKSDELSGEYLSTSLDGFNLAMNVSVYTLTLIAREARHLLSKSDQGGSILTLSYLGGERVMPGYNVMGVAKSALEMSVRYLANDMGANNIRVNAISAGPINTLAARGIHGFSEILKVVREKAPLKRNVDAEEVGKAAAFLCSQASSGITGEVMHVDAGYHCMA